MIFHEAVPQLNLIVIIKQDQPIIERLQQLHEQMQALHVSAVRSWAQHVESCSKISTLVRSAGIESSVISNSR